MTDNKVIQRLAESCDSFYLYSESEIRKRMKRLQNSFPGVDFLYSVKCNSNANVLSAIWQGGFGADVASLGEVEMATKFGLSKDQIYFSAPGKSKEDLQGALSKAVIIADSLSEIERISQITKEKTMIGLRINPDFTFTEEEGLPSKFGIDEKEALTFLKTMPYSNIQIGGIHVHVKSQELNKEILLRYYAHLFSLAERVEEVLKQPLSFVNMGSGIGIPYREEEREVDIPSLGRLFKEKAVNYKWSHPQTKLIMETGRYVVGKSGIYVTHVVDRKVSHGKTYILLQNTLNGFLRPSLAALILKYAKGAVETTEPLFSGFASSQLKTLKEGDEECVQVCGNLCTAADIVFSDIKLPKLDYKDVVWFTNAGSYAAALSPMQFSSQNRPKEYMLCEDGSVLGIWP